MTTPKQTGTVRTHFLYESVPNTNIRTVESVPTADMPLGFYKVIARGLFYGHYQIVRTWTGEKAVIAEYASYAG